MANLHISVQSDGELTFFHLFILQDMSSPGTESLQVDINLPPDVPQYVVEEQEAGASQAFQNPTQAAPPVIVNVFTRKFQSTLGFSNAQAQILAEGRYDTTDRVIYWKVSDIQSWCQLKTNIPMSHGGLSFGEREIKCLQPIAWWVTDLTLQGKPIELNHFKSDIMSGAIEESRLNYEDTRDRKGELDKPKELAHDKWTQWEDSIYNYLSLQNNIHGVPLSNIIGKETSGPDDSETM